MNVVEVRMRNIACEPADNVSAGNDTTPYPYCSGIVTVTPIVPMGNMNLKLCNCVNLRRHEFGVRVTLKCGYFLLYPLPLIPKEFDAQLYIIHDIHTTNTDNLLSIL